MDGDNSYPTEVSWDNKWAMTMVLMADVTGKESYKTLAENFMTMILSLPTTPKGLVWTSNSQWGSLRYNFYLS